VDVSGVSGVEPETVSGEWVKTPETPMETGVGSGDGDERDKPYTAI